jgi:hypothetical protein
VSVTEFIFTPLGVLLSFWLLVLVVFVARKFFFKK